MFSERFVSRVLKSLWNKLLSVFKLGWNKMSIKQKYVMVLFFILLGYTLVGVYLPYNQRNRALVSLEKYTSELGLINVKSSCNKDGDGDGYASCSYNNGTRVVNLECDSAFLFNAVSCKKPKNMF